MTEETENKRDSKKFLGIYFECCHVYGRLYQNIQGTHYVGRCPKCMANLKVPIGEKGSNRRFFKAQ
jgi:hypothetical protein